MCVQYEINPPRSAVEAKCEQSAEYVNLINFNILYFRPVRALDLACALGGCQCIISNINFKRFEHDCVVSLRFH